VSEPQSRAWSPGFVLFAVAAVAAGWLAADDVGFSDSGELGAAAFGLGVAHPTGFACDLLLLRAASLFPLGHVAFRHNALIALQAALCLGLLAQIANELAARLDVRSAGARWAAAIMPLGALCGWATFERTALTTEVYTLALLLVALAAFGTVRGGRARALGLCVVGLAPGLHVTAGLYSLALTAVTCLVQGRRALRFVLTRVPAVAACALIIAYLPLASLRDPPIDWGDPQTPARVLAHLTAARIRSAYHAEMLEATPDFAFSIASQWLELWPALVLALGALALGLRKDRWAVLGPTGLLAADLAYAAWINPMGAADRQVGHVAGAALAVLAGLGAALICVRLPARARPFAAALLIALGAFLPLRLPAAELSDGYAASELVGSGGPLAALPPRSILVCGDDDTCAGAWFALYVEGVRPDVSVVPAQHLWDPTVRRLLYGTSLRSASEPAERDRAAVADAVVRRLASGQEPRPALFTDADVWSRAHVPGLPQASELVPYVQRDPGRASEGALLAALDGRASARFALDASGPLIRGAHAREAWSSAYGGLGKALLSRSPRNAVSALRRAVQLDPERASAWSNLGVALEASGDLERAVQSTRRAAFLDPSRPTPWVNLVRLEVRRRNRRGALTALDTAREYGVHDPRLDALAAQLSAHIPH
jgi:Flp pilus assembly protein TadD